MIRNHRRAVSVVCCDCSASRFCSPAQTDIRKWLEQAGVEQASLSRATFENLTLTSAGLADAAMTSPHFRDTLARGSAKKPLCFTGSHKAIREMGHGQG